MPTPDPHSLNLPLQKTKTNWAKLMVSFLDHMSNTIIGTVIGVWRPMELAMILMAWRGNLINHNINSPQRYAMQTFGYSPTSSYPVKRLYLAHEPQIKSTNSHNITISLFLIHYGEYCNFTITTLKDMIHKDIKYGLIGRILTIIYC